MRAEPSLASFVTPYWVSGSRPPVSGAGDGSCGPYTAADDAYATPGMRSRRRFTASSTFTVPTTLTDAPSGGFSRQNGTCNPARCTTRVTSCSSSARSSVGEIGDVSRDNRHRGCQRPEDELAAVTGRSPRSKPTTSSPSSSDACAAQAPRQPRTPVTRTRSPSTPRERGVLVHGDGLRVELDRCPALLVRPPAGALDAAERHVHVRAGRLRVDVQDPRLQLLCEAVGRVQVAREDRRGEAERDGVRALDHLVERSVAVQASSPARRPPRRTGTHRPRRLRTRSARSGSPSSSARSPPAIDRATLSRPRSIAARISSSGPSLTTGPTSVSGSAGSPTFPAATRASSFSRNAS